MLFGELLTEQRKLFVVWLTGALAACSSTLPMEREVPQQPPSSVGEVEISRKVLLLGDTQLHELYGGPIFLAGAFAQDISGVAVRPAHKRLFGSELLKRVISWNKEGENLPIIHMGDAIDVSCATEWERFIKLMELTGNRAEWVLIPGNHDGYFEGIVYPEKDENPSKDRRPRNRRYGNKNWDLRCDADGIPGDPRPKNLRKPGFIHAYLEAKNLRGRCSNENATDSVVSCKGRQEDLVETVIYHIAEKPWQSFLLQIIKLTPSNPGVETTGVAPPVFGLLLDTSQYKKSRKLSILSILPRSARDAGRHGEILQDQTDEAVAEIERLRKGSPSARIILFGHHDLNSLRQATRGRLAKMIKAGAQPLYVSAHTHLGFWKSHRLHESINMIELNVGSLLDWPVHFRDFQLFRGAAPNIIHSNAYLFSPNSNNDGNRVAELTCNDAWYPDKDVNTTRRQERTHLRDLLMQNRAKQFWTKVARVAELVGEHETLKDRREFLLGNLRAELLEYQALLDTFPSSKLREYRSKIKAELKRPDLSSHQKLLRMLRANESKVDSDQPRISDYKMCLAVDAAEKVPIQDEKVTRAYQKHIIDCIKEKDTVIGGKVPVACNGL